MEAAWAQVFVGIGQVSIGLAQCAIIWYGLRLMQTTSADRNRQLDQQGKALENIGAGIQELLKRSA